MKKISVMSLAFSLILILLLALGTACHLPLGNDLLSKVDTVLDNVNSSRSIPLAESQSSVLPTIADVVAAVKPSVVAIDTETTFQIFRRSFTQQGAGSGCLVR